MGLSCYATTKDSNNNKISIKKSKTQSEEKKTKKKVKKKDVRKSDNKDNEKDLNDNNKIKKNGKQKIFL